MSDHLSKELLSASLDGELSPTEKAELERRLEESLELREELAALEDIRQQMRMLPRPYAPAALRRNVMDRAERASSPTASRLGRTPRRSMQRLAGWLTVGVAASLLIIAGWSLNRPAARHEKLAARQMDRFDAPPAPALLPGAPQEAQQEAAGDVSGFLMRKQAPAPAGSTLSESPGGARESEPVQVVSVSPEEIRRRIDELERKPQRGNTIQVPGRLREQNGETPIVVVFTVVDVMEAMDQMQVLVQQQQIRSRDSQTLSFAPKNDGNSSLTAVTVELEMDGPEMAAVLNSVAAFDAVMYVEEDVVASSAAAAKASTADRNGDGGAVNGATIGRAMPMPADELAGQRQFNFQQLAEQSGGQENGVRRAKDPAARARQAGEKESARVAEKLGLEGRPRPPAAAPLSADSAKPVREMPAGSEAKVVGKPVQESSSPMEERKALSLTPGWEEARRFRAFILLKQQSAGVKNSRPSPRP